MRRVTPSGAEGDLDVDDNVMTGMQCMHVCIDAGLHDGIYISSMSLSRVPSYTVYEKVTDGQWAVITSKPFLRVQ